MFVELLQNVETHRAHRRPGQGGFQHVQGMADGGHENLCGVVVVVEDRLDLADDVHAHVADRIQPAHEGADVGRPALRGQQGLQWREGDRDVGLDPFRGKALHGAEPVAGDGDLDDDIVGDLGQLPAFGVVRVAVQHAITSRLTGPGTARQISS